MKHRHPAIPRARRAHGFTLLQMVIVLPLLGVFMVAGSQLFIINNTLMKETTAAQERLGRADAAVHRLRLDVMTLSNHPVDGDRALLFEVPGVGEVYWRVDDNGDLTRSVVSGEQADTPQRRYTELGTVRFDRAAGSVVLWIGDERYLCPLGSAPPAGWDEGVVP